MKYKRQYLLGECFDKTGNKQMAEECMRYVLHMEIQCLSKESAGMDLSNMPKKN